MIPLTPEAVMGIWKGVAELEFDTTYGGFPGQDARRPDLKKQVLDSMKLWVRKAGYSNAEILAVELDA